MTVQELAAVAGVVVAGVGVFKWMLKSHEDVCAERYAGILNIQKQYERQADQRHQENLDRMDAHDEKLGAIYDHLLRGGKR